MSSNKSPVPAGTERQLTVMAGLFNQFRLVWKLFTDDRVSMLVKSIVPLSFIYTISPVDFIPDVILGLGQLDDLGVILLGLALFIKLAPPDLVEFYRNQIEFGGDDLNIVEENENTVDTTFRILGDDEEKPDQLEDRDAK